MFKKNISSLTSGFTMIEMVVSVGIFVVITTVVLANYQKFLNTVSLSGLASEIAVSIRQAQVYGQNVREFAESNTFPSYGAFFDANVTGSFILFADIVGANKRYDGSVLCGTSDTECLEKFSIQSRASVVNLCGNMKTGGGTCGLSSLDIAFTRPNPDASIIGVSNGTPVVYSDAEIVIGAINEAVQKTVVVWANGQISVE